MHTIEQFGDWLRAEIQVLAEDHPADNHYEDAATTIREARQIALSLGLLEVVAICERVKIPKLSLDRAQQLLAECIRAIKTSARGSLTIKQGADHLGVSSEMMYRLVAQGAIRHYRVGGAASVSHERAWTPIGWK